MGRARHTHALDRIIQREFPVYGLHHTPTTEKVVEDVKVAVCGHEVRASWDHDRDFDDNHNNVSCPTCNKKLAQAALKARPPGSGRLLIEADKAAKGYFRHNGGSKVILNGEVIGYVGYQDHGWRLYPLMLERYDDKARAGGAYVRNSPTPLKTDGTTQARALYEYLGRDVFAFKSKEAAALGCEQQHRAGLMLTEAQLWAEANAAEITAQAEQAAREQRKAERQAAKDETLQGLNEILERETLSNFQRQALMTAIAKVEAQKVTGYLD